MFHTTGAHWCMRQVVLKCCPGRHIVVPLLARRLRHHADLSASCLAHHVVWGANAAHQQPRMTQSALHAGTHCEQRTTSTRCAAAGSWQQISRSKVWVRQRQRSSQVGRSSSKDSSKGGSRNQAHSCCTYFRLQTQVRCFRVGPTGRRCAVKHWQGTACIATLLVCCVQPVINISVFTWQSTSTTCNTSYETASGPTMAVTTSLS